MICIFEELTTSLYVSAVYPNIPVPLKGDVYKRQILRSLAEKPYLVHLYCHLCLVMFDVINKMFIS